MSSSPSTDKASSSIDKEKLSTEIVTVEDVAPSSPSVAVDHKKVLRKLDLRLMPPVCLLYLFCFLDRANITNAEVAGMGTDLHFTGIQFNLCIALTLIPYCLLHSPSNILLKKVGPARWLPIIMFVWGSIVVSMAFARSFAGLMTARGFLGAAESGLLPGLTYYLSAWYPKFAQAKRIGLMYSGVSIAGGFGGLLAYIIQDKMHGLGGLAGWCWIFLCEGLMTVVIAVILFFYMYDYPENATFLTDAERVWLLETLKLDSAAGSKKFKRKFIVQAIKEPKAYLFASLFFLSAIPGASFSTFLPTIINGMGFSSTQAQILTIPPNIAGCFFTLCISYLSDKKHFRGPFILAWCPVAILGYALLIGTRTLAAQYLGSVLVLGGIIPCVAMQLSWTGGNFAGELKRAVVIGMVLGIIAAFIYRLQDSPRFLLGHTICISSLCMFYVMCIVAILTLHTLNKKKIAQCERDGLTLADEDAFTELGDRSPLYRYTL
ncbi:MFS general substrate transporter [Ganoderma sinense ZZ0214-1]|uniref:MFS general substrate transporter n=1 Tax=Ganoderma sinense ZZ0214-1 TaxID=1077348 RepID=A0A2G8S7D8_9APHY|nr:MFS general substrate transporter [Ganoderma sinense ZZ0214-1]